MAMYVDTGTSDGDDMTRSSEAPLTLGYNLDKAVLMALKASRYPTVGYAI